MTLTKDYFRRFIGNREITELPHEIELTIIDNGWFGQREFHVRVKYVWDCGVGYPEKTMAGCTYCSVMNGNIVRLSNGTEFVYKRGETDLVKLILNAAGPELKLAASDEIEFMDI
jgi:hypothetical protein